MKLGFFVLAFGLLTAPTAHAEDAPLALTPMACDGRIIQINNYGTSVIPEDARVGSGFRFLEEKILPQVQANFRFLKHVNLVEQANMQKTAYPIPFKQTVIRYATGADLPCVNAMKSFLQAQFQHSYQRALTVHAEQAPVGCKISPRRVYFGTCEIDNPGTLFVYWPQNL